MWARSASCLEETLPPFHAPFFASYRAPLHAPSHTPLRALLRGMPYPGVCGTVPGGMSCCKSARDCLRRRSQQSHREKHDRSRATLVPLGAARRCAGSVPRPVTTLRSPGAPLRIRGRGPPESNRSAQLAASRNRRAGPAVQHPREQDPTEQDSIEQDSPKMTARIADSATRGAPPSMLGVSWPAAIEPWPLAHRSACTAPISSSILVLGREPCGFAR